MPGEVVQLIQDIASRTNLLALMESEFVVWPPFPDQDLMGTPLAADTPPNPFPSGENAFGFSGRPVGH